jgi:hypothetical protein
LPREPTPGRGLDARRSRCRPNEPEVVAGELVPADPALAAPITLFGTSDPRIALERMSDIATALVDVIEKKNLFATINGRRHITAEGWTTLGGMVGVVPIVTNTRANDSGDGIVAHVEARTLDGRIVGAADAECSRAERRWRDRDPFAIRSMAQTRAISRALRAPLGQIVVLAGYDPAGAEEMPTEPLTGTPADDPIPSEHRPTVEQQTRLIELLTKLREIDPETDWSARAREVAGVAYDHLTKAIISDLIMKLEHELGGWQGAAT